MSIFYSKSTGGFYNQDLHADHIPGCNIPDDAIEITDEYHIELFEGQANGLQIITDKKGYPVLSEPVRSLEEQQTIQKHILEGAYNDECVSNVTVGGNTFYADKQSVTALQNYMQIGEVPDGFYWKSADKVEVPFTIMDVKNLLVAIQNRNWTSFQKYQALKTSVNDAKTPEVAKGIVW